MRRLVFAILLVGLARPVLAQPIESETGAAVDPPPMRPQVDDQTGSAKHPTELMRERQQMELSGEGGRSGFWTSRQPAKGGAYRWRLLLIGIGLIGLTGGAIVYLIKRANRLNRSRPDPWASWVASKRAAAPATPAKPDDKPASA